MLQCTKFNFGWDSAPDSAGELTAVPNPLAGFMGTISKSGKGRKGGEGNPRLVSLINVFLCRQRRHSVRVLKFSLVQSLILTYSNCI